LLRQLGRLIVIVQSLVAISFSATPREIYSGSCVYIFYKPTPNETTTGSGFLMIRPVGIQLPGNVSGQAVLITNKHVLPSEGTERVLTMRVQITDKGVTNIKEIDVPICGKDGRYLPTVSIHRIADVAVVRVTEQIIKNNIKAEFIPVDSLGTKARVKNVALVGDEVYMLGYPAGIYDVRNVNPIWRIGIVSTSPVMGYSFTEQLQRTWHLPSNVDGFLIDAQVYPGSSGSMVVFKPQVSSFDAPSVVMAGGPRSIPYVMGIVSDSIPIVDVNLRLITRMGLGIVQSADVIQETIDVLFK
jgi:hypothetical protein